MNKQQKMDQLFLDLALRVAEMSYAERRKVGGILVKDGNIIAFGWNGTPSGFNNKCEDENYNTKEIVLHAELNIFSKLAKSTQSSANSTLYLTLSPCVECSKLIIQSGVERVVYLEKYRKECGLLFLRTAGVETDHLGGDREGV